MDTSEQFELIKRGTEEVLTEDDLKKYLEKRNYKTKEQNDRKEKPVANNDEFSKFSQENATAWRSKW